MKKLLLFVMVLAICMPAMCGVSRVQLGWQESPYGPFQTGSGGEFSFRVLSGWDPLYLYDSKATVLDPSNNVYFQTFCLETDEKVSGNTQYDATISWYAELGGKETDSGDPLSKGVAYLYHEFQKGTLTGYIYDKTNLTGRKSTAGALQEAIWNLEGEGSYTVASWIQNDLLMEFGLSGETWNTVAFQDRIRSDNYVNGVRAYDVAVMNVWGVDGVGNVYQQDMVVCIPAPGALVLSALGTSLVGWIRRRHV